MTKGCKGLGATQVGGLEPGEASISWLWLHEMAPVSAISWASDLELLKKNPFRRAPSEAGAEAMDEALPEGL
jgi:hypothetical protein